MKPINNWDKVQAAGDIESLPVGGYVCEIKQVKEVPNRSASGTHLEVLFDVCEGDFRGFFEQDYRSQDREDKFWRGVIRQNCPNEGSDKYEQHKKFFKRFINAIEDSNPGYHWDWNEAGLKGKRVGVLFGERERQSQKGTLYVITEAREVLHAEDARQGKYKIPEKKLLSPSNSASSGGFAPIEENDEELPF